MPEPVARSLVLAALLLAVGGAGLNGQPALAADSTVVDDGQPDRQILVTVKLKSSWRAPRAGSSGSWLAGGYRASARTQRVVSNLARSYDLRQVSSWPIGILGVHCVVFEIPSGTTADQIIGRLEDDERVESAQPMNVFEAKASGYNDPYLDLQHGVTSMQVEEAHRWARGAGVLIAVVDTGVDLDHPELRDHIRLARDFVEDTGREFSADRHGTAVAGVIVSTVDNGIGIIGVAPAAQLLALRACWQDRDSTLGRCNSFTLAKALTFAIERKADILNLSLAGPADPLLERLVRAALDRGIVVVAASGELSSQPFPSKIDGVLGVRAVQADGAAVALISDGRADLVAPGTEIITTVPGGSFDFLSGHSLATAHVSGVVALLLERQPRLDGMQIYSLLRDTSMPGDPHHEGSSVMVNACAAVSRVVPGPGCPLEN